MKILHIISSGGMYGAESVILNLSKALEEEGHRSMAAVFWNTQNPNLEFREVADRAGIETHLLLCDGQFDSSVMGRIRDLACRTNADIVHTHNYKADIFASLALRGRPNALVSTCHSWLDTNPKVYVYGVVDRFMLKRFDHVCAVSEAIKLRLLKSGLAESKISIIPNGIDIAPYEYAGALRSSSQDSRHEYTVGLVGRLSKEKAIHVFVQAANLLRYQFPNAKFVIYGEGPERKNLERQIRKLKLSDRVSLHGRSSDMPSVYASLDVLVSTSLNEGLPMTLLEGMASQLPIIATPVGDIPSLIPSSEYGILIPPNDASALASEIGQILRNPDKREDLGMRAQWRIQESFSSRAMADHYLRVYKNAVIAAKTRVAALSEPVAA
jgi:glycosyltransferase involved in cell wall biosynthesis